MELVTSDREIPYATQCDECCNTYLSVIDFESFGGRVSVCTTCIMEALEMISPDIVITYKK